MCTYKLRVSILPSLLVGGGVVARRADANESREEGRRWRSMPSSPEPASTPRIDDPGQASVSLW